MTLGRACRYGGLSTAIVLASAMAASAGSFALKERSTKAQGLSFAGVTAGSGGLSSMAFNPAALGIVENLEMSGGASLISPIADGTVQTGPNAGQSVDPSKLAAVANGYIGYRIDEEFLIGASMYSPFGLTTQYEPTDAPAVDALTSKLLSLVIAPTVAYQPIPTLTLAASANITYFDARLTSTGQQLNGNPVVDLSFSAGVMWDATPSTTVGVAYQHGYDLVIPGTLTVNAGAAFGGANTAAEASAYLPSVISAGIVQDLTDDFRVMGEVQWQNWSVFDNIAISSPSNPFLPFALDTQNYEDAFYVAAGGEYDISNDLTVRMGAAWDQTPTSSSIVPGTPAALNITNRTARVPDEDRIWLSIGGSYDLNDHMSFDIGYSYLFTLEDPVVGLRNSPGGPQTGTQVTFSGGAHILSVGGSMKF